MSHARRREGADVPKGYKEEPAPVADDLHHPHPSQHGLPPPHQHLQHQRPGVIQQHHPDSPHQPQAPQQQAPGPYASPHIPSHSLPPQHQSPYVGSLPGPGQPPEAVPYYTHPSPFSTNSATGSYSSSGKSPFFSDDDEEEQRGRGEDNFRRPTVQSPNHPLTGPILAGYSGPYYSNRIPLESVDPTGMATATMHPRYPPMYSTPQSNSPGSVQSPQHDQHGRPIYQQPTMYYPSYSMPQQSPYGQHPVAPQPGPINTQFMPQQPGQPLAQHTSHPVTPALTGSPGTKLPPGQLQRQGTGLSPASATPTGAPGSATSLHGGPPGSAVNPNAAPGPIPATTPLVVRQDQNGVQWIAFEYSRDRVKMEYTIRCDVESVDVNSLPQDFKTENCVYPRACCPKDQYKGNRLHYETECNTVGWALAQLNPCLRGKRGLIQRAVDSWRNSNQDPRLRSRRVRRMAKINNRKAVAAQHGTHHMAGPGAPGQAGVPAPGLAAAGPRQPMPMGGSQPFHHHHEQPGGDPAGPQDVSASAEYNDGSHTHHHQAPNGNSSSPNEVRQAHQFYPTYPAAPAMVSSGIPASGDGIEQVGGHAPSHAAAVATSKQEEEERNVALFGDLPEAKRRKFILVDDAQRGTRVRVRVMLDQVKMHEMPDSYRKNNSVYPRSWFATEMQSPPPSPRRGRWPSDVDANEAARPEVETLVPVPMLDGSEAKVQVPRMNRTKRTKEVTLNDLGYRMSWSQSRVFSGRTLFLQRSLDAYRNKMRSTMVAAGQDVSAVAPHFETRVGKRKWMERSKKTKREGSP